MIRMRMVEPEQLAAEFRRALLREPIVGRPDQESPARAFFGRIRQRLGMGHHSVGADERAATLVRIRFLTVPANRRYASCFICASPARVRCIDSIPSARNSANRPH